MPNFSRRSLLAAPFFVRHLISAPPSDRVRLAAMGADGMAWATLRDIATHPSVDLVCVAEVDSGRTARVKARYPLAQLHQDWRKMLAQQHKNLDAVCVGTPDHMHASQAMRAMRYGLHVYCQKPLTSHVYEARQLTKYAQAHRLVTQMGIQVHSSSEYQVAVNVVHAGTIGKIKEVHAWSNKKWGELTPRPAQTDPVPAGLDWDGWIGVGQPAPYLKDYYHPANWRKRLEFGTGTFGDMGCHIYDPVFGALDLTAPLSVRAEGPAPAGGNWAIDAIVKYVFPGTRYTDGPTVAVTWYDGDERPSHEIQALIEGTTLPDQGSILVGTQGVMLIPHVAFPALFPRATFADFKLPEIQKNNHYHQFAEAVKGHGQTSAAFSYSGPLSETVLLGSLATRFPKTTLEWDSARLKFKNEKAANVFLKRKYRAGWKVKGLG